MENKAQSWALSFILHWEQKRQTHHAEVCTSKLIHKHKKELTYLNEEPALLFYNDNNSI